MDRPSVEEVLTGDLEGGTRPTVRRWTFLRRKRFLVLGAVLALALAWLIYMGVQSASMYYLTVGELLARGEAAYTEDVRVGGTVDPGSVHSEANMVLHFTLRDETNSLPVVYQGVVPDAFKPGGEVVLEGRLSRSQTFEASALLAKCPSKYIPGT